MCVRVLERGGLLQVAKLIFLLLGVREPVNRIFRPKTHSDFFVEQHKFLHTTVLPRVLPLGGRLEVGGHR